MFKIIWKKIFLRICEIFVLTMLFSVPLTFANLKINASGVTIFVILLVGAVAFMLCQATALRKRRYEILDLRYYFGINFVAVGLSAMLHGWIALNINDEMYDWLFSATKVMCYGNFGFSMLQSSLLYYGVIIVLTFVFSIDFFKLQRKFRYVLEK